MDWRACKLHIFLLLLAMNFAVCDNFCKQLRPRLGTTERLIYTRSQTTHGCETTRGNVLGAKHLGEEMVCGPHVPDSFEAQKHRMQRTL